MLLIYELDKKRILKYELFGILFIVILGSALHFTYDLSGNNPLVGLFLLSTRASGSI